MKKILGIALLLTLTMAAKSQVKIGFEVSFKEPQAHYAEVEMNVAGIAAKDYVDLKMPVWTPGSYLVREFAKNLQKRFEHICRFRIFQCQEEQLRDKQIVRKRFP